MSKSLYAKRPPPSWTTNHLRVNANIVDMPIGIDESRLCLSDRLQTYPNPDIKQKLRPSFDGLASDQKRMFLDIACAFVGENKDFAASVLDSHNCSANSIIEVLVDKSLITVSATNMSLQMHELIQSMAREIVREKIDENYFPYVIKEFLKREVIGTQDSYMILLCYTRDTWGWTQAKNYVTFSFFEENNEDVELKEFGVRLICDEDIEQEADLSMLQGLATPTQHGGVLGLDPRLCS
nr:NB-ARC domains-containing protein [Tanacetum cinerariifolium]